MQCDIEEERQVYEKGGNDFVQNTQCETQKAGGVEAERQSGSEKERENGATY